MIAFLEITQSVIGGVLPDALSYGTKATLIDDTQINPDIKLHTSFLTISKSESSGYVSVVAKIDNDILEEISTFIATASLKLELLMNGVDNNVYTILSETYTLDDYRIDEGVNSKSVQITASDSIVDVLGSDHTIQSLISKKREVSSDGSIINTYEIHQSEYRYIGVSRLITEGSTTSKVLSKSLSMEATTATLVVKAEEI